MTEKTLLSHLTNEVEGVDRFIQMALIGVANYGDLNVLDSVYGVLPLHYLIMVVRNPIVFRKILTAMISSGADIHIKNAVGENAIHMSIKESNLVAFRSFIELGMDPLLSVSSTDGVITYPLDLAAEAMRYREVSVPASNSIDILEYLVTCGATIPNQYQIESNRPSALIFVAGGPDHGIFGDFFSACDLIIKSGANIFTLERKTNRQAIHYAAIRGYWRTVVILAKYGADVNLKDGNGFSAADYAEQFASQSSELRAAIRASQMKKLISKKAD